MFINTFIYCEEFSSNSLSMPIINCRTRVGICNTGLPFLKKKLNVSQSNKCFYVTHAKVYSCLMLVMFYLLLVNMYLLSLKININFAIMVAKSFNSCIVLSNYIITICISITSILITKILTKSGYRT